ncbi:MAG: hypothetical protein K2N23_00310 [Clostridia bacterium]|nr:hypothetical protein [Clostridia bacterium]
MVPKEQVYKDTVEIVKSAVSSSYEHNNLLNGSSTGLIKNFIKAVYEALTEINK